MTKLSYDPQWKENNKWEIIGLCYILSTTKLRSEPGGVEPPLCCTDCAAGGGDSPPCSGGLRGAGRPPLWGLGQRPEKFFFGPYIRLGKPTYGFHSMVLDAMVFSPWFWTRWFFGPWYWMLRHV